MILIVLFVVVIGVGIGVRRAAHGHPLSEFDMKAAVLSGGVIAVVRLGLFWTALALSRSADWRQVAGYVLLLFSAIVEMTLVSWARSVSVAGSITLVSALIVVTSFVLGWARTWLAGRKGADETRG